MGKKIILGICGAVFALGLFSFIGGHALGGRVGSLTARDGWLVYDSANGTIQLTELPYGWLDNTDAFSFFSFGYWNSDRPTTGYDTSTSTVAAESRREALTTEIVQQSIPLLSISVDAGYVHLVSGEEWGVEVDGPMEYSSYTDGDEWYFTATTNTGNLTTRTVNGRTHYFQNGVDITTDYTFTIPMNADTVELYNAAGGISVQNVTADTISIFGEVTAIEINGLTAATATLGTQVGAMEIKNLEADDCNIYTEIGAVSLKGTVHDTLSISAEIGVVEATLTRPDEYGYNAVGSLSNIQIDGHRLVSYLEGASNYNMGADTIFNLSSELGSITIDFN